MERSIVGRAGVGMTAKIIQHNPLTFARVVIDQDILVVVRQGTKTVRWNNCEYTLQPRDAIAIAGGRTLDITNRLGENGLYEAVWLVWDRELIASYAKQHTAGLQPVGDLWPMRDLERGFVRAFEEAISCLSETQIPTSIAQHRLSEVLVWMELHGARFRPADFEPLTARVRQMLSSQLDKDWTAPCIAKDLGMSEATLRRRLANEHISLSELLIDVQDVIGADAAPINESSDIANLARSRL